MPHVYLDEDVPLKLAPLLRTSGIVARTTQDEDRKRSSDDEQLFFARQRQWVLVGHNREDFRLIHDTLTRWGCQPLHSGILLMDQAPVADLARALMEFFGDYHSLENQLWVWTIDVGWEAAPRGLFWKAHLP